MYSYSPDIEKKLFWNNLLHHFLVILCSKVYVSYSQELLSFSLLLWMKFESHNDYSLWIIHRDCQEEFCAKQTKNAHKKKTAQSTQMYFSMAGLNSTQFNHKIIYPKSFKATAFLFKSYYRNGFCWGLKFVRNFLSNMASYNNNFTNGYQTKVKIISLDLLFFSLSLIRHQIEYIKNKSINLIDIGSGDLGFWLHEPIYLYL